MQLDCTKEYLEFYETNNLSTCKALPLSHAVMFKINISQNNHTQEWNYMQSIVAFETFNNYS